MAGNVTQIVPEELGGGAAYRLLVSAVVPRPIGWISTVGADGTANLAPFSYFNGVSSVPPTVMFSAGRRADGTKDTLRNCEETGEFVAHIVNEDLAEQMNVTAGNWPYAEDEFEKAGLETAPSVDVQPLRVAAAPIAMEAKVTQIVPVEGTPSTMVLGRVVRFHIREDLLRLEGGIDAEQLRPIARLGWPDEYTTLGKVFSLSRPKVQRDTKST